MAGRSRGVPARGAASLPHDLGLPNGGCGDRCRRRRARRDGQSTIARTRSSHPHPDESGRRAHANAWRWQSSVAAIGVAPTGSLNVQHRHVLEMRQRPCQRVAPREGRCDACAQRRHDLRARADAEGRRFGLGVPGIAADLMRADVSPAWRSATSEQPRSSKAMWCCLEAVVMAIHKESRASKTEKGPTIGDASARPIVGVRAGILGGKGRRYTLPGCCPPDQTGLAAACRAMSVSEAG